MKNKVENSGGTYSYWYQVGDSPQVTNPGYFDYTREFVISSTDAAQNYGNHKTGTPFYYRVEKQLPFHGSYHYTTPFDVKVGGSGQLVSFYDARGLSASLESAVREKALSNALDKIRGNIDLSVDAFQISKTISMIKSPIRSLTTLAKAWKHKTLRQYVTRRWKQRPPLADYLSNKWLEYQYGWYPLVSSAYEIAGQMANIKKEGPSEQLFVAGQKDSDLYTDVMRNQNFAGTTHNINRTTNVSYAYRVYIVLMVSDADKARMVSTYTSMNPASIKWELVPYSFVVDWFYDIGSYLRGCETSTIYSSVFKAGWTSELRLNKTQYLGGQAPTGVSGSLSGSASSERLEFIRTKLETMPFPQKPVVGGLGDLRSNQIISALALLKQAFK